VPAPVFEYAIVRVVPRVEREEFVNAGVVLYCPTQDFLECRIGVDHERLRALDPALDVDAIDRHLAAFAAVCRGDASAGPIARLPLRERYHWLVAPRSTTIQTSAVHAGRADDVGAALEHLFATYVAH
jgi:hypothetical protein